MPDILQVTLLIIVGIVVGFINTLAGSGSVITLPLLIFLGLPANVANGTNRIAIFLQSVVGVRGFQRQKYLDTKNGLWPVIVAVIGSLIGASIAVELNNQLMEKIIGIVMVLMFFVIIYKPDQWIKTQISSENKKFSILQLLIFFAIGIYGGLVQAGVGIFLLSALVLGAGYDLIRANALKLLIVAIYTPVALAVFIYYDQVNFIWGLILGGGNMIGATLATRFAVSWGPKYIRYILLTMIIVSSLKLFGLLDFLF
ncbi:MAG: sulfite exporter TauE/SafE family protein [Bacteroidales bacterium]|nr:sulfite exporter TauE/SafE family protein [Bacteroidales bacterium]